MRPDFVTSEKLEQFINLALEEDIGDGDHSSNSAIPENAIGAAQILIKDDGILAGVDLALLIFRQFDQGLDVEINFQDGDSVSAGDIALEIQGKTRSILSTERLVLNCMQRMSGIATYTSALVELVKTSGVKILDTRKTSPNFRMLEKWAVSIGGGENHRNGLFDMVMLKDNHIDYAGGIKQAVKACKKYLIENNKKLKIEVETRNLKEVQDVLDVGGVDIIMLDNMIPSEMKEAVQLIAGRLKVEASGGINETNLKAVADTGVDSISIGALTHSVKSLDMSMKAI